MYRAQINYCANQISYIQNSIYGFQNILRRQKFGGQMNVECYREGKYIYKGTDQRIKYYTIQQRSP
jgi:hypothetical protein